jgi:hypothetical protein
MKYRKHKIAFLIFDDADGNKFIYMLLIYHENIIIFGIQYY